MASRSRGLKSAEVARWLRADARDVVRVEPVPGAPGAAATPAPAGTAETGAQSPPLDDGLARWRRRVARRRMAAVIRRQLVLALALGVVLEVIALVAGTSTPARAWWLLAPLLLGLAAVAAGARRGPRTGEIARLLDRDLALAERLDTALELESRPGSETGLAAMVIAEATAAASASLPAARAALTPAPREWGALPVLAVVLAALLVVPARSSVVHRSAANPRGAAPGAAAKGRAPSAPGHAHVATPPASASQPGAGHRPPPLVLGQAQTSAGQNRELAQGPSAGKPSRGAPPGQLARAGNGASAPNANAGAGQSGASATGGLGGQAGRASGGQASRSSGSAGPARPGGASVGGFGSASRPAAGAQAGVAAPNSPGAPGAAKTSAGRGASGSRRAPGGGETAGSGRGSTGERRHGPPSKLGTAAAGLPIQSGYTPSRSSHGSASTGNSATSGGGSGPGRVAKAGVGSGSSAGTFPYIPPTPSSAAPLDEPLLLSYFSSYSWLTATSW
jgi:hypothetical protein